MPPLPPLPVPVPGLPLIALLKPIWIGISPQGYNVSRTSITGKNTLDLNRNESAGSNTNESDVVTANSQDADIATRTSIQNAAVIVVGVEGVVLSAGHNVRAQAQRARIVNSRDRSYLSAAVHDVAKQVASERSRAVYKLVCRNTIGSAANRRPSNIRDIDAVAVDDRERTPGL